MFHHYLTTILRHLRRRSLFSLINIAGLAVGLASCLLILLYLRHELTYDRHHEQADRIFRLTRAYDYPSGYNHHFARVPDTWINELPDAFPEIERLVRLQEYRTAHIRIGETKFREPLAFATDPYIFEVFSLPLLYGNPQTALAEPYSAVLSQAIAEKYFGDENPIGRIIQLYGESQGEPQEYRVTGVMENLPPASHFRINMLTSFRSPEQRTGWAYVYLLLKEGAEPEKLAAKLPGFVEQHIDEKDAAATNQLQLQPLTDIHLHSHLARELQPNGNITNLYLFAVVALFILLLAGANFVNLSVALSSERARELGMRRILGSSRRQLIAYLLGESFVFALIAFGIALGLAALALPRLEALIETSIYLWSWKVLSGFFILSLLAGLLAGLYPALMATTTKSIDAVKGQALIVFAGQSFPIRKALTTLQFTLSVGLIICTAVAYQQFRFLQEKNLGFDKEQVISIPDIPREALSEYYTFKQSVEQLPGVKAVSAAMGEPSRQIRDSGTAAAEEISQEEGLTMDILPVAPNFFQTMGIELAAGALFQAATINEAEVSFPDNFEAIMDRVNSAQRTYILNEAAVAALGWESPKAAIGKSFSWSNSAVKLQRGPVIGVVKDFNFHALHDAVRPMVMICEPQFYGCFLIKAAPQEIEGTMAAIQKKWDALLPEYAFEYHFLDSRFAQLYKAEKQQAGLLGLFSLIAVCIAAMGIFGLSAITARQRKKEIGIRKVLGASVLQAVGLLSREFTRLALIANLIAWPIAYGLAHYWLQGFAYHITFNFLLFPLAALATLAVVLLAAGWHSLQAATANPVESIRTE